MVLGFIRLSTSPNVFQQPLTAEAAVGVVDGWVAQPVVRWQAPDGQHWELVRRNVESIGTAGKLATDAHIAAVAAEFGLIVHSNDADFARFPGIKWVNPFNRPSAGRRGLPGVRDNLRPFFGKICVVFRSMGAVFCLVKEDTSHGHR